MAITMRAGEARDIPAIAAIYGYHVLHGTASFEIEAPGEAEMERRWRDIVSKDLPYLVAEEDGKVVGYAYASMYRPRLAYRFTVEDSVYIRPDRMGNGIGSLLMPALIGACERRGYRQMIAVIGDSANEGSVRLRRRFGFRDVGVLRDVGFKFDRWLDTVFMQRALQPAEDGTV